MVDGKHTHASFYAGKAVEVMMEMMMKKMMMVDNDDEKESEETCETM